MRDLYTKDDSTVRISFSHLGEKPSSVASMVKNKEPIAVVFDRSVAVGEVTSITSAVKKLLGDTAPKFIRVCANSPEGPNVSRTHEGARDLAFAA